MAFAARLKGASNLDGSLRPDSWGRFIRRAVVTMSCRLRHRCESAAVAVEQMVWPGRVYARGYARDASGDRIICALL